MASNLRKIDSEKTFALNVFNLDKIGAVNDFYKIYREICQLFHEALSDEERYAELENRSVNIENVDNFIRWDAIKLCNYLINKHRLIFDGGPKNLHATKHGFDQFTASSFCLHPSPPLDDYDTFSVFLEEVQYAVTKELYFKVQGADTKRSFIDYIYYIDRFINRFIERYTPEIKPTKEELYLFKKIVAVHCHKNNHYVVPRIYYAWGTDEESCVPLPAHYCLDCRKYYIGKTTYNMYVEDHGQLVAEKYQYEDFNNVFSRFNPETKLHSYGYTVDVDGPPKEKRRDLLVYLIKSGRMTYREICETIENDIMIFEDNERYDRAVGEWMSDLKYLGDLVLKGKITR